VTPFWRRPIWILGHLIALTAVLVFVRAGFWQIDRLHEKQARNRLEASRSDGPAIDIADVDLDAAQYQHVTATGHFDVDGQVTIRNRAYEGTNGFHVVTPLVLGDGSAVLVNRGWIGVDDEPPPPPSGEVTIEGLLLTSQTRSFGPKDPSAGTLDVLNRIDVPRIQAQVDARLYPLFLQQTAPSPAEGALPLLVDPPPRDEGPHRSYAIQWFLFAGVVLVGYPLLMRRRARGPKRTSEEPDPDEPWVNPGRTLTR
jgi:surfeit locus 1 family protein